MNEKEALEDFIKKTGDGIYLLTERMKLVEEELLKLGEIAGLVTARIDVLSKRLEIVEEQLDQKEQFFTGGGG